MKSFNQTKLFAILISIVLLSLTVHEKSIAFENDEWRDNKRLYDEDTGRSGYISPRISGGAYFGEDFSNYGGGGIAFGYDIDTKQTVELDFALARVETDGNGSVTKLFDNDAQILSAAINYRYFFTPRHAFPGTYILLGLAYNGLNWDYKEGVQDQDGRAITGDDLDGTEISAGLGITLFSARNIDLRFEMIPSLVLWEDNTGKGLDHNFNPTRLVKFRVACDFYLPE